MNGTLTARIFPHGRSLQRVRTGRVKIGIVASDGPKQSASKLRRDEIILEYLPYVKAVASSVYRKLRGAIPFDDLMSSGSMGLIKAVDAFDGSLGAELRTFADYKIRGAIFDSLRQDNRSSTSARNQKKQIDGATQKLSSRLQRYPHSQEIAAELGLTLDEYHRRRANSSLRFMCLQTEDPFRPAIIDRIASRQWDPHQRLEQESLRVEIAAAIGKLAHHEALVIRLYYGKEMTLQQIANILQVHHTRVHQLKKSALSRLRLLLQEEQGSASVN